MRFNRIITGTITAGLVGLVPVTVSSPASAAATYGTAVALEAGAPAVVYGDDRPYLVALIEADDGADEDEVQKAIDEANNDLAKIEQVKKFHILDRELSQDEGELTPTLKLKREKVYENFKEEIDALYDGDDD